MFKLILTRFGFFPILVQVKCEHYAKTPESTPQTAGMRLWLQVNFHNDYFAAPGNNHSRAFKKRVDGQNVGSF